MFLSAMSDTLASLPHILFDSTVYYKLTMNHYIEPVKKYVTTHKKEFITGGVAVVIVITLVALYIYNNPKVVVYEPINACAMLTPVKAEELLGEKVYSVDTKGSMISGNIATSKCSYTDQNHDTSKLLVAAIAVRSGVNDKGVQQNKTDFAARRPATGMETVNNLGDSAYFNPTLGQLNVLSGRQWIIISYGIGAAPQTNTVDKAVELAHKVLR